MQIVEQTCSVWMIFDSRSAVKKLDSALAVQDLLEQEEEEFCWKYIVVVEKETRETIGVL